MKSGIIAAAAGAVLASGSANAVEIKVLTTQAPERAYRELLPQFEAASGHKVTTVFTGTVDVQRRVAAGEMYDLIIMAGPALDALIASGKVVAGSRVDIAKSGVGAAVPAGAAKPNITTVEALKQTLIAAKSIGYSTGPSGVYLTGLFQRLGLAEVVKPKLKQTPTGVFVATIVSNREVEIGFQQVSEFLHAPGVDYVGPLPAEVQEVTVFSAGIQAGARQADAAKAWVRFLTAPAAADVYRKMGLEPG